MAHLSVAEAVDCYPLSAPHICPLVRTGPVKSQRFGKAARAVDERSVKAYLSKQRRPGRKPRKVDKRASKRA